MSNTKPKPIQFARLLKLADFLDKLPRAKFDFNVTRRTVKKTKTNDCGTVGCAIGWCPNVFPKLVQARVTEGFTQFIMDGVETSDWVYVGEQLFDMPNEEACELFTPSTCDEISAKDETKMTPKQVAKRIRSYVTKKKACEP